MVMLRIISSLVFGVLLTGYSVAAIAFAAWRMFYPNALQMCPS
jgi:hypothetical protein